MQTILNDNKNSMPPQVASIFYPKEREKLISQIENISQSNPYKLIPQNYKALIVPHAGIDFSGQAAYSAIASLKQWYDNNQEPQNSNQSFDNLTFFVLGPAHRFAFSGVALPGAESSLYEYLETPIAKSYIDKKIAIELLTSFNFVQATNNAYINEHSIEMMLIFIQHHFPNAKIVPLVIGDIPSEQLNKIIEHLWHKPNSHFILSSDLSHFLPLDKANEKDLNTLHQIEAIQDNLMLKGDNACGYKIINAFNVSAAKRGLRATRIAYATSATFNKDTSKVVGYGAIGYTYPLATKLPNFIKDEFRRVAKSVLNYALEKGKPPQIASNTFYFPLQTLGNSFVTINKNGNLRGCIGSMIPTKPLVADVAENTFKAAFQDPRFKPITKEEVLNNKFEIKISILSKPALINVVSENDLLNKLQPDVDGLIISGNGKRALFLPSVWESIYNPKDFVSKLKLKAGLKIDEWPSDMQCYKFNAEYF